MKRIFLIIVFLLSISVKSQQSEFPKSFEGKWKGNLEVYSDGQTDEKPSQTVSMEMIIKPIKENHWTWIVIYDVEGQPIRNYELIRNTEKNTWEIDEKNGIVITQKLIGNRLTSSFDVMGSIIFCSYWIEDGKLKFEINMVQKTEDKTGLGTDESPEVSIYNIRAFQKAILIKQ